MMLLTRSPEMLEEIHKKKKSNKQIVKLSKESTSLQNHYLIEGQAYICQQDELTVLKEKKQQQMI